MPQILQAIGLLLQITALDNLYINHRYLTTCPNKLNCTVEYTVQCMPYCKDIKSMEQGKIQGHLEQQVINHFCNNIVGQRRRLHPVQALLKQHVRNLSSVLLLFIDLLIKFVKDPKPDTVSNPSVPNTCFFNCFFIGEFWTLSCFIDVSPFLTFKNSIS